MQTFRPSTTLAIPDGPVDLDNVCLLIDHLWLPAHFFLAPDLKLLWEFVPDEEIPWEIHQGHLIDPALTRQRRRFWAWNIHQLDGEQKSTQPLLAIKVDPLEKTVFVTRGLLCQAWEAFDAGGNVIETRQRPRWVAELVGTQRLEDFASLAELQDELTCLLWQAVVGTSRLPLHSVETPLPAFSFGQLAYVFRSQVQKKNLDERRVPPLRRPEEVLEQGFLESVGEREQAKILEVFLRSASPEDLIQGTRILKSRWAADETLRRFRTLFNDVSLSPYTDFVPRTLEFLRHLVEQEVIPELARLDFLGWLLRQLGRHLTAYDLVNFHHGGANYPDALVLEAAMREYLELADQNTPAFLEATHAGLLRRRALRQASLLWRRYENHPVPDLPTSPGENQRVLPIPPVPEEQLTRPLSRKRKLFVDQSLADLMTTQHWQIMLQALADLRRPDEWAELGMAVFIDRPLGKGKAPGEPDQTPLLAHEAYSAIIAQRRWVELVCFTEQAGRPLPSDLVAEMNQREPPTALGLPVSQVPPPGRSVPSLADAQRAGADFLALRTLSGGLQEIQAIFPDLSFSMDSVRLLVRLGTSEENSCLVTLDRNLAPVFRFDVDARLGFICRAGVEKPRAGWRKY